MFILRFLVDPPDIQGSPSDGCKVRRVCHVDFFVSSVDTRREGVIIKCEVESQTQIQKHSSCYPLLFVPPALCQKEYHHLQEPKKCLMLRCWPVFFAEKTGKEYSTTERSDVFVFKREKGERTSSPKREGASGAYK